jgi:type IV pilus assembly protein PilC
MGNWRWEGLDSKGKRSSGTVEATTEKEARRLLRAQGVRPQAVLPPSILEFDISEWMVEKGIAKPFGQKELNNFTKQMAIMIGAGIPILQCLEIQIKSQNNAVLRRSIKNIHREVGQGKSVSEAMMKQTGFDRLYCNLVKAGEAGGILEGILNKLTEHMERQEKTKSQVKSALMYPSIVSLVGAAVIWAMLTFVVPQFVGMLADTGQDTPFITQLVIDTSDFLGEHSLTALPILMVFAFIVNSWKKTPSGKVVFDQLIMRLPLLGGIVIKGNLASFCRTLSTMLGAGVSLIDSLEICIETIDNGVIAKDIQEVRKKVVEGKSITEPMSKITYFPEMVVQMVRVGEQTGNVDQMLEKVATVFEAEVSELVEGMTKLIEPIIIVVLGGIIATILVAMYLPMFMSAGN